MKNWIFFFGGMKVKHNQKYLELTPGGAKGTISSTRRNMNWDQPHAGHGSYFLFYVVLVLDILKY